MPIFGYPTPYTIPRCLNTDTIEFAVKNPDPAAAGTPIPGYVESPVAHRFVTPVAGPGGNSAPYTLNRVMSTPGPYVPSVFFTNRFCVSGVATNSHSTRFRMSFPVHAFAPVVDHEVVDPE